MSHLIGKTFLVFLSLIGLFDASYLTYQHFSGLVPPCQLGSIFDCGGVLQSEYAVIFGIPLALLGVGYYLVSLFFSSWILLRNEKLAKWAILFVGCGGVVASTYFVYLQLSVLKAVCLYCMISALISFLLFVVGQFIFGKEREELFGKFFQKKQAS